MTGQPVAAVMRSARLCQRSLGTGPRCMRSGLPWATLRISTGLVPVFGSKTYACGQRRAEMGAAFCCASLDLAPTIRLADHTGFWLDVLRKDM